MPSRSLVDGMSRGPEAAERATARPSAPLGRYQPLGFARCTERPHLHLERYGLRRIADTVRSRFWTRELNGFGLKAAQLGHEPGRSRSTCRRRVRGASQPPATDLHTPARRRPASRRTGAAGPLPATTTWSYIATRDFEEAQSGLAVRRRKRWTPFIRRSRAEATASLMLDAERAQPARSGATRGRSSAATWPDDFQATAALPDPRPSAPFTTPSRPCSRTLR